MIDERVLKEKIEKIENERGCSFNFDNAKKLIEKVQGEYIYGMPREAFINLVENKRRSLELNYDYCTVAFSYFGGNKRKRKKESAQKNRNTEHLQESFPFDKKIVFTRAEI